MTIRERTKAAKLLPKRNTAVTGTVGLLLLAREENILDTQAFLDALERIRWGRIL